MLKFWGKGNKTLSYQILMCFILSQRWMHVFRCCLTAKIKNTSQWCHLVALTKEAVVSVRRHFQYTSMTSSVTKKNSFRWHHLEEFFYKLLSFFYRAIESQGGKLKIGEFTLYRCTCFSPTPQKKWKSFTCTNIDIFHVLSWRCLWKMFPILGAVLQTS